MEKVKYVILGAGTAGLSAMAEIKKVSKDFLLIDPGPIGTTCARTGCMPSKVLLQTAEDVARAQHTVHAGFIDGTLGAIDSRKVMQHVRKLRDYFTHSAERAVHDNEEHYIKAAGKFLKADVLQVGDRQIQFECAIVATGTSPIVPPAWQKFGDKILTSETLFELAELPRRMAVIGGGPLGLELAQGLHKLGVQITCFAQNAKLGGLTDPAVQKAAHKILGQEFTLHVGQAAEIAEGLRVYAGEVSVTVDAVLASLGRKPNLQGLDFAKLGVECDQKGIPKFNAQTMQVGQLPIFLAGDLAGDRPVLHEAAFEGRVAGFNASHEPKEFARYTPLSIGFTEPGMAKVGLAHAELPAGAVAGEIDFADQGRSRVKGVNRGLLRIYADGKTGRLLGAEMICPEAEHLAHLLALALEQKLTVATLLQMPIYHPTVQEGLRTALRDLNKKVSAPCEPIQSVVCEGGAQGSA